MQPYLFPYVGYFQLIQSVDRFVLFDDVQFSKGGWFNRNRVLVSGSAWMFTVPLRKDSHTLSIRDRSLSADRWHHIENIITTIENSYKKAPHFSSTFSLIESVFMYERSNLFEYLYNSLRCVSEHLGIPRGTFLASSEVEISPSLRGQDRVVAICQSLGAEVYINPIGGSALYNAQAFAESGIELKFLRPRIHEYRQFDHDFVPSLSIIDVLMFNGVDVTRQMLQDYHLVQANS